MMANNNPANEGSTSLLLTDLYQVTMVYAYWQAGRHNSPAVFEMFFRKNPFKGEFTIFAGLREIADQILRRKLCFTADDIAYLKTVLPDTTPTEFFAYLSTLDCSQVTIHSVREGTVVFPRLPGYASLLASNAARMRICAGKQKELLEFGLRRSQGADGAMSAARYAYLGGFDSTSNVAAGKRFGIPVRGTHAHSFVASFHGEDDLKNVNTVIKGPINTLDILPLARLFRDILAAHFVGKNATTHEGELIAFVTYAVAFPPRFLALVDTYDTLNSGVLNFLAVAAALHVTGYKAVGVRLDSGDLAQLSLKTRDIFSTAPQVLVNAGAIKSGIDEIAYFSKFTIVVSDGINTSKLLKFQKDGHSIDSFGIGTNLATCQEQPALGMVYKLVEVDGKECMKLSSDAGKILLPGRKKLYRLYDEAGMAAMDVLESFTEGTAHDIPKVGKQWTGSWPLGKRREELGENGIKFIPSKVEELLEHVWGPGAPDLEETIVDLHAAKAHSEAQKLLIPASIMSVENATTYPTFVSWPLFKATSKYIQQAKNMALAKTEASGVTC